MTSRSPQHAPQSPPGWTATAPSLAALDPESLARLDRLTPIDAPRGTVLFRPGECAQAFVVVLSGRIEVFLTGPTGREIMLYAVDPGQSCVQSTLGLLGGEEFAGEGVTATECRLVLIPEALFLSLLDASAAFRAFVFTAFAARMQGMLALLERVAFQRIEARLAGALLDLAESGCVHATHQDLATRIGTAREVVSRRLDAFTRKGMVATERGAVTLTDLPALRRLAAIDA